MLCPKITNNDVQLHEKNNIFQKIINVLTFPLSSISNTTSSKGVKGLHWMRSSSGLSSFDLSVATFFSVARRVLDHSLSRRI